MAKLILCVGLPRSGKTTWAKKQNKPIVNRDSIRLAFHGQAYLGKAEPMVSVIEQIMVEALVLAGHEEVIIDATHTTATRRNAWNNRGYDLTYVFFRTSKETCIKRAMSDGREDLIPVIERMDSQRDFDTDEVKDEEANPMR